MGVFIREIAILLGLLPRVISPPPPRQVAVCDRCGREAPSGGQVCSECGGTVFSFHPVAETTMPSMERRANPWAWLTLLALIYASVRLGGSTPLWNLGALLAFGLTLTLLRPAPDTDWVAPSGAYILGLVAGLMLLIPFRLNAPVDGRIAQALTLLLGLVLVLSPAARGENEGEGP